MFPANYSPFFSGYGNRITDAVSYRSVGIDLNRIFIINEKSEVIQMNDQYKKTYKSLNNVYNIYKIIIIIK